MTNTRQKSAISSKPVKRAKKERCRDKKLSLADELLQLDDDFSEYCEISAFMCQALANALSNHESLNKDVIAGAMRCSNWLQFRSEDMKNAIRETRARHANDSFS